VIEIASVPSAAATGKNLVIFPDHRDPASSVHLLGVEPAKL
jgi:hypothetical protein